MKNELRRVHNSRGEVSTSHNARSMNKERYDFNQLEKFSSKDSDQSINLEKKFFNGRRQLKSLSFCVPTI